MEKTLEVHMDEKTLLDAGFQKSGENILFRKRESGIDVYRIINSRDRIYEQTRIGEGYCRNGEM